MIQRLADDHANARRLAEGIAALPGIRSPGGIAQPQDGPLDPGRVLTNFVLFRVDRERQAFLAALEARGVAMVAYTHGQVRAVTHHGITVLDIDRVIAAVADVLHETAPSPAGDPAATAA
jgi:threonine aldolase